MAGFLSIPGLPREQFYRRDDSSRGRAAMSPIRTVCDCARSRVRHDGGLLMLLGTPLALASWWALLALFNGAAARYGG